MIPVIGSLVMGSFAGALFWATISLGRPAAGTPPKR
jgi:hypothetical protein